MDHGRLVPFHRFASLLILLYRLLLLIALLLLVAVDDVFIMMLLFVVRDDVLLSLSRWCITSILLLFSSTLLLPPLRVIRVGAPRTRPSEIGKRARRHKEPTHNARENRKSGQYYPSRRHPRR